MHAVVWILEVKFLMTKPIVQIVFDLTKACTNANPVKTGPTKGLIFLEPPVQGVKQKSVKIARNTKTTTTVYLK